MAYRGSVLPSGEFLSCNPQGLADWMSSPDYVAGEPWGYTGTLFPSGNFVITPASSSVPVWQSGDFAKTAHPFRAMMQTDGDFSIQDASHGGWSPVWRSSALPNWLPPAQGSEFFAILRNDGNLTVFQGADQATNYDGIWTTAACLQLDGTSCVIAPHDFAFELGDFTIECWLALGVQPGNGSTIMSSAIPGVNYSGFFLSVTNDGAFHFGLANGELAFYQIDSAPTYALDGNFHHLAVVRQNNGLLMYFDTEPLPFTVSIGGSADLNITGVMYTVIGAQSNGYNADTGAYENPTNFLIGCLTELRVWSLACPQQQIFVNSRQRLRGGMPSAGGLMALWPLNSSGTGSIQLNEIINANNGTVWGNVAFGLSTCPADLSIYP